MSWIKNTPENKPEPNVYVWITMADGKVYRSAWLDGPEKYWHESITGVFFDDKVIAWKPFVPEPYKE